MREPDQNQDFSNKVLPNLDYVLHQNFVDDRFLSIPILVQRIPKEILGH